MRILTVHNKYRFRGGEDESRESEDRLLVSRGHEVREIVFDNKRIKTWHNALCAGFGASWSLSAYARVKAVLEDWRPDVLDVHNFFPLASPSVHFASRSLGVPVVQTLHNFRLLCPAGTFFRRGLVCEDCSELSVPLPGIVHRCYRASAVQTAAVALMITTHRLLKTWSRAVSLFIAVSEFAKQKFVEAGFSPAKIVVKPNFVMNADAPGTGGDAFLFVGRLSPEKGIRTLIRAMDLGVPAVLNVIGEGPMEAEVREAESRNCLIRYLGRRPHSEVLRMMGQSRCVVFPSEWYETFGRVAAESYACGTPVIASRIGAVQEIVDEGRTGFHFQPGDPEDLAHVMTKAVAAPEKLAEMRIQARKKYEEQYTPEHNYDLLMAAYRTAIDNP